VNRSHIFLAAYQETGSVSKAALAAGINRSIHYRRLKEDPEYKAAFDAAHEVAIAVLEDEAIRRAVEGVDEPIVYQGRLTYNDLNVDDDGNPTGPPMAIRKYSDSLLQFLLRGAKPETYRERFQHDVNANINVTKFKGSLEDLLVIYRGLAEKENDSEAA
jgi:hypothetical protein